MDRTVSLGWQRRELLLLFEVPDGLPHVEGRQQVDAAAAAAAAVVVLLEIVPVKRRGAISLRGEPRL